MVEEPQPLLPDFEAQTPIDEVTISRLTSLVNGNEDAKMAISKALNEGMMNNEGYECLRLNYELSDVKIVITLLKYFIFLDGHPGYKVMSRRIAEAMSYSNPNVTGHTADVIKAFKVGDNELAINNFLRYNNIIDPYFVVRPYGEEEPEISEDDDMGFEL